MSTPAMADSNLYCGYADWKGWQGEFTASDRDERYFAAEFAALPVVAGQSVLEIGFGNGAFLAWARARGASVVGTEADAAMVAAARAKGFDAYPADLDALRAAGRRFDLVAAFDVLEHWDKQTLIANLGAIRALLNPGGSLLARFPNGHSPFGRLHQYGDLTHQTVLSATSIRQLAQMTGFVVTDVRNAARVPAKRGWWSALKNAWRKLRCARTEIAFGKLYQVGRLPLDPNLVAVLQRLP